MPAVIGPERDDGVAGVGPFLQSIEHVAEHGVGKVNGGEVTLHGRFPLLVLTDVGEVPVGPAAFAFGRQVVEVVGLVAGRQLDGVQRKRLEIFLRHEPGLVRAIDAAGKEEGAAGPVPGAGEGLGQQLGLGEDFAHALVVGVQTGAVRGTAGENGRARGVAGGSRTMGVGEEYARGGQPIEVGRASLRMAAEATDPVVQIINGDKEDVGLGDRRSLYVGDTEDAKQ